MKKILAAIAVALMIAMPMSAKSRYSHNIKELPTTAQATLSKYFASVGVNHIKIDSHFFGGNEYDVVLDNGTEIEFDSDGVWKEVDSGHFAVPTAMIPATVKKYVDAKYPKRDIVKIEKQRGKVKVELNNGLELTFDKVGTLLKTDR